MSNNNPTNNNPTNNNPTNNPNNNNTTNNKPTTNTTTNNNTTTNKPTTNTTTNNKPTNNKPTTNKPTTNTTTNNKEDFNDIKPDSVFHVLSTNNNTTNNNPTNKKKPRTVVISIKEKKYYPSANQNIEDIKSRGILFIDIDNKEDFNDIKPGSVFHVLALRPLEIPRKIELEKIPGKLDLDTLGASTFVYQNVQQKNKYAFTAIQTNALTGQAKLKLISGHLPRALNSGFLEQLGTCANKITHIKPRESIYPMCAFVLAKRITLPEKEEEKKPEDVKEEAKKEEEKNDAKKEEAKNDVVKKSCATLIYYMGFSTSNYFDPNNPRHSNPNKTKHFDPNNPKHFNPNNPFNPNKTKPFNPNKSNSKNSDNKSNSNNSDKNSNKNDLKNNIGELIDSYIEKAEKAEKDKIEGKIFSIDETLYKKNLISIYRTERKTQLKEVSGNVIKDGKITANALFNELEMIEFLNSEQYAEKKLEKFFTDYKTLKSESQYKQTQNAIRKQAKKEIEHTITSLITKLNKPAYVRPSRSKPKVNPENKNDVAEKKEKVKNPKNKKEEKKPEDVKEEAKKEEEKKT